MRSVLRTAGVLAVASASLVGMAGPSLATPARTIVSGHVAVSGVSGRLPVGASVSQIQVCPQGSRLDEAMSKAGGEMHSPTLRVTSREYWPAGLVVRYRVVKAIGTADPAVLGTIAVCSHAVPAGARTVSGRAKVDLRVWGPAPTRVELLDSVAVAVSDDLDAGYLFRTAMRAAGVSSNRASVAGAVRAVQEVVHADGADAVVAVGQTERSIVRGRFASMQNRYSYTAQLDQKVTEG